MSSLASEEHGLSWEVAIVACSRSVSKVDYEADNLEEEEQSSNDLEDVDEKSVTDVSFSERGNLPSLCPDSGCKSQ